jgi:hypothetical protein
MCSAKEAEVAGWNTAGCLCMLIVFRFVGFPEEHEGATDFRPRTLFVEDYFDLVLQYRGGP